ncbi:hypothetical protein LCGC14_2152270, partial [marine sediment metagenome]
HGGGVCAEDTAVVTFTDCIFSENQASAGGAIHWGNANLRISDSDFTFNSAYHGGGLFGIDGLATIIGCTFSNNEADTNDPNVVILGDGGALHLWATEADIIDCDFSGNKAEASGGGVYFGGENVSSLKNCLFTNNTAGRDGGGVSANIFSQLAISNCTIADNIAAGTEFPTAYGGGLYCSDGGNTDIINSILWGNSANLGPQIAIDPCSAAVNVTYSDVMGGAVAVYGNSALVWDDVNNLTGTVSDPDSEPSFVSGDMGIYYLSQPAADPNQTTLSPCVDAGSDDANFLDMYRHTTRTDLVIDTGSVDLGYHYVLTTDLAGDFNFDGVVDELDWAILQDYWLNTGCAFPYWCNGTDLNQDGMVNNADYAIFADNYKETETEAPTPNPMTWEIAPTSVGENSIGMIATTATDNSGTSIEYKFERVYPDYYPRIWDPCSTYTDTGLATGVKYGYKVKARDTSVNQNETDWSFIGYAITGEGGVGPGPEDHTPPTGLRWEPEPYATSPNSIAMGAYHEDPSGVQYYFEEYYFSGLNSGWQDSPTWEPIWLTPNMMYTFRVKARDKSLWHNETAWSITASETTPEEGVVEDTEAPVTPIGPYHPYTGAPDYPVYYPYKSAFAVLPQQQLLSDGYHHVMTAATATDATGPVLYK